MTGEELFLQLIGGYEGPHMDFKTEHYEKENRYAFVKDVLALANTPRDQDAHIVFGVNYRPESGRQLVGLARQVDDTHYIGLLGPDLVSPLPKIEYIPVRHDERDFGILRIAISPDGPFLPTKKLGDELDEAQWWMRRGSANVRPNSAEVRACTDWFQALRRGRPQLALPMRSTDGQAWEVFRNACDGFDGRNRHFALIVDPVLGADASLDGLALAPWSFVIDFDANSDKGGLLSALQGRLQQNRTLYMAVKGDRHPFNPRSSTVWFFARGLVGSKAPLNEKAARDWLKEYGLEVSAQFTSFAAAVTPDPVTVVVLWRDQALGRHLRSTLEKFNEVLGDLARVVVATPDRTAVEAVEGEDLAIVVEIDLRSVAAGLADHFVGGLAAGEQSFVLPMRSGAFYTLNTKDRVWINEELDIVHRSVWESGPDSPDEFRKGATVSWRDLHLDHDCARDVNKSLIQQVEVDLQKNQLARINVFHRPGAGGTTAARRLLWHLHERYPCLVLTQGVASETAERIGKVYALTENSVLVLLDGSVFDDQLSETLYQQLKIKQTPAVLLLVRRRFEKPTTDGPRSFWLAEELSRKEADQFAAKYAAIVPDRTEQLKALTKASGRDRSAFYFGLTAFGRDFVGLPKYVAAKLASLAEPHRPVAVFLALAHHYAQQGLPAQAFANQLGFPIGNTLMLERVLPAEFQELLVRTETGEWRMAHDLFAEECLWQMLASASEDREQLWKQHLSAWAIKFIEFTRGNSQTPGDRMLELVRDTFIDRDIAGLLADEQEARSRFAKILDDIPLPIGREIVLKTLTEVYPQEAHFHAHLGRYYGLLGRHDEARLALETALQLHPDDATLHHMRGMAFRYQVNGLIAQRLPLSEVLPVAQEASQSFTTSRELKPDNERGYVSEVQLLIKILDYAAKANARSVGALTSDPTTDPFLREALDRAEDLLARVRVIRQGDRPSRYELECRHRLTALYGDHKSAITGWYNLLQRPGVVKAPIRRQIVWAILDSYNGDWRALRAIPKDMDRVIKALTENISESLKDDRSFRLWLRAQRAAKNPFPLDQIIERVSYWRSNSDSIEAPFYLYVLQVLKCLEGFPIAKKEAEDALAYCRHLARGNRTRNHTVEWLADGQGIHRLVHDTDLGDWVDDFRENRNLLVRLTGRVAEYENPQAGWITLEQAGMTAFFVPVHSGLRREDVHRTVEFYLGFRYEGLKAWDVKPLASGVGGREQSL